MRDLVVKRTLKQQRGHTANLVVVAEAAANVRLRQAGKRRGLERLDVAPKDVEARAAVLAVASVVPIPLQNLLGSRLP